MVFLSKRRRKGSGIIAIINVYLVSKLRFNYDIKETKKY